MRPVHLIEIGASAGALLRVDRYRYVLGGRQFGDPRSPVEIDAAWHGDRPVPDLDAVPPLASVTGVDLNPLDAANADDRHWLEALIWPENRYEADLLRRADVDSVAGDDARRVGSDDSECPALAADLPPDEPRVVFHSMTRMHVPADRLAAFDAAIGALGRNAPLFWLSLEGQGELDLRGPDGSLSHRARVGGRIEWVEPLVRLA